jgi:3D (Asp-Asp-Asp) domain-containing protein
MRSRTARFSGPAAVLTLVAASAAIAAPGSGNPASAQELSSKAHQALLSLYALDSQLHAWQAQVASLEDKTTALRRQRTALRQELGATETSLKNGQRQLALELRALYERGNVNSLAVILGASSLTKALGQIDVLSRVADQRKQIVAATTAAQARLLDEQARLAAEQTRLMRALVAAQQSEQSLAAADAARRSYISSLRSRLRATQVQSVEATAQAAQQKSQTLQTTPATPSSGKRQLTVSATCYILSGTTATGMPVGRGVVAVDPSVIPLGSRLYIPGYGNGVAADVGGGIRGSTIDLWYPTYKECAAWGRRTVTITIY